MVLSYLGFADTSNLHRNLPVSELVAHALKNNEGTLAENGALAINTGKYTGRSPNDRFIVRQDSVDDKINWGDVVKSVDEETFTKLHRQVIEYLQDQDLYLFDGFVGANKDYRMSIRVISEYASQALFANQLFIRPTADELEKFEAEFTVLAAPGFKAKGKADGVNSEVFILINFEQKIVLIGGSQYSGEIKKSVFSIMNYLLPLKGVFPMHCSANIGVNGDTAIFFGLSGTGKTTLSADPNRRLIGDDEHGWCDQGIFNFEGGCYAKTINLSKEKEPDIYNAIRFGSLLENVVLKENKETDYDDGSLTENTRAAYPLHFIDNVEESGVGDHAKTVIFLTADAFGVLPPVSKLSKEAAMYHFLSGYTSKLAGTERGITEPEATFSTCFGEPFMLMNPTVYADLLGERINKHGSEVYLINTGWSGGGYGVGERIDLAHTRAMVTAALEGALKDVEYMQDPIFNLAIPTTCPGVPSEILNPINTWDDKEAYKEKAKALANEFRKNFKKFEDAAQEVIDAGPKKF